MIASLTKEQLGSLKKEEELFIQKMNTVIDPTDILDINRGLQKLNELLVKLNQS